MLFITDNTAYLVTNITSELMEVEVYQPDADIPADPAIPRREFDPYDPLQTMRKYQLTFGLVVTTVKIPLKESHD